MLEITESPFTIEQQKMRTHRENMFSQLRSMGYKNKKVYGLIMEAYRRYMMFSDEKPIDEAWVGLGTNAMYEKCSLFKCVGHKAPARCNNWWILNEKGLEVMNELIAKCPIPTDNKEKSELNHLLFGA
jgi:hypothetical protein